MGRPNLRPFLGGLIEIQQATMGRDPLDWALSLGLTLKFDNPPNYSVPPCRTTRYQLTVNYALVHYHKI